MTPLVRPPAGALIRHTTTFPDGTTITTEGRVNADEQPEYADPLIYIGDARIVAYLTRPDQAASVQIDVLETLPPEPPNGTVLCNGIDVFIRCDDENDPGVGAWYCTGDKQIWTWAEVVPTINPGYRRYIPDPADDVPAKAVLDAALAWVACVHKGSSPPNMWADTHDFVLIEAVDAYNAAREVEQS